MRNFTLHKFLAMLLMAVCSATLSVAQNVAQIGTTKYATLQEVLKTEDIHPPKTGISVHFSGSLV